MQEREVEAASVPKQAPVLISVIVPVYNVEDYLAQCIDSLLAQTFDDYEIVLVDDGSTDGSSQICEEYGLREDRVVVLHKENGGLSDARNAGVQRAAGQYITFVDSDDYVFPNYLDLLYSALPKERISDQAMVFGKLIVQRDGKKSLDSDTRISRRVRGKQAVMDEVFKDPNLVSACAKLAHREIYEKHPFQCGSYYEDLAVFGKHINAAQDVVLCDVPIYVYQKHADSITTKRVFSQKKETDYEKAINAFASDCSIIAGIDTENITAFAALQYVRLYEHLINSNADPDESMRILHHLKRDKEAIMQSRLSRTAKFRILGCACLPRMYAALSRLRSTLC